MTHTRVPLLLLAFSVACAETEAPTDLESPSLARPPANGPRIRDLGTLGGTESYGRSLNTPSLGKRLLVVGFGNTAAFGPSKAAYWLVDTATWQVEKAFLPSIAGAGQTAATDVNQAEEIVGRSYYVDPSDALTASHATHWTRNGASWAPALVPTLHPYSRHEATAINANGQIAGASPAPSGAERVYLFDGSTATDRGGIANSGEANDVNIDGIIVGMMRTPTNRAFVAHPNSDPVLLPDLGGHSLATAINDAGVIVGFARNAAGESRAVRWIRSAESGVYSMEDLGYSNARAFDINNAGEIVGAFVGSRGERPFFRDRQGTMKELPILSYAGFAYAINENAQIVGMSYVRNTYPRAVLWTNVR